MRFHTIVVGAGSAGGVLAARLTEDPSRSVLLIEAGPDFGSTVDGQPAEVLDAADAGPTQYDWGHQARLGAVGTTSPVFAGRLVGGSSATNNVMALRGQPADYDGWGGPFWRYDAVRPAFERAERMVNVRRYSGNELASVHRAFLTACLALGHAGVDDHNAPGAIGAGVIPVNESGGVRQSTALTYLAAARQRPNLEIKAESVVDTLLLSGGRAAGVRIRQAGTAETPPREENASQPVVEEIESDRVILCAGAYGSPAILLRSGIGRPGVGENLHDHPLLRLRFEARGPSTQPPLQTLLTTDELQVFPSGIDNGELTLLVALLTPRSRGAVRLSSDRDSVEIDNGLLRDPDDLGRLLAGVELARELAATRPLSDHLGTELTAGADVVAECLNVYQHPVGTCAIGTVVDGYGRVLGIDGLSVVDASIMPTIPRANTNLPTLMLAEHLAPTLSR